MDWLTLLGAVGIGSTITVFAQWALARSDASRLLRFTERKEAYLGLLEAYHRCAVDGTEEAAKNFAFWQLRSELVGSKAVREAIEEIIKSNDDSARRAVAHERMKLTMRRDLNISES